MTPIRPSVVNGQTKGSWGVRGGGIELPGSVFISVAGAGRACTKHLSRLTRRRRAEPRAVDGVGRGLETYQYPRTVRSRVGLKRAVRSSS